MNPSALRILDANANRAREALRVIEDYARFALNDETLCTQLKNLRHDFSQATRPFLAEAILHRDTPGDVGTAIKTTAEMQRADLNAVVTAAGKRLGEALRAIEEVAKTLDSPGLEACGTEPAGPAPVGPEPAGLEPVAGQSALPGNALQAGQIEALRYRFYAIEQAIARTLRPHACAFADVRLYVLITESLCSRPWLETAQLAIDGGADCLQLREKSLDGAELLCRAKQFVELCRKRHVLSIINDRVDIARLSDADGVHLGQGDLPCIEARKLLGVNKIIGVSTHHLDQARQAVRNGADYIGVGPVFPSQTKPRDILPGLDYARQAATEISIPSVAIAGITAQNLAAVLKTGIRSVAVSSAVISAPDIRAAAEAFRREDSPQRRKAR